MHKGCSKSMWLRIGQDKGGRKLEIGGLQQWPFG